jgi:ribosomal protein S18 acetylase RimI-like enzyme
MTPADGPAVFSLQLAYAACFPGATIILPEVYLSPGFNGGEHVLCALDGERLVAYAPLFLQVVEDGPADLPHIAWVEVKALPDLPEIEPVKDALLDQALVRLRERMAGLPPRPVRLTFEYAAGEDAAAAFVLARGFDYLESAFHMRRDLSQTIPEPRAAPEISIRRWRMESEAEQRAYVAARTACFPEAPLPLADWQYYMRSPYWAEGTMIAAFAGDRLVGGVNVYSIPDESAAAEIPFGYTEDIFVLPEYRGKGAAHAMIAEGMRFLKERGFSEARLAVRAKNEQALPLYRGLGYAVHSESRYYAKHITA